MVVAAVAGESFPIDSPMKEDSAERDSICYEVLHGDYGSWSPTPKVPKRSPAPVPHDFIPPRRLKV